MHRIGLPAVMEACKTILDARIDPPKSLAFAFDGRGAAYYELGKDDQALADFIEAIRLRPACAMALNHRGTVYAARHADDLAIADSSEALRLGTLPTLDFDPAKTHISRKQGASPSP